MRSSGLGAHDARRPRGRGPEHFGVHPVRLDSPRAKRHLDIGEITSRSAEVEVRVSRDRELLKERPSQVAPQIVVAAETIGGARPAVDGAEMAVAERRDQPAGLACKRVMGPVVRRVDPPDVACLSVVARGRMEHAEERRHSDARAQQDDRGRTGRERKRSARRADVQETSNLDVPVEECAASTALVLHADQVGSGMRRAAEGVIPEDGRTVRAWAQPDDDVLPGKRVRQP